MRNKNILLIAALFLAVISLEAQSSGGYFFGVKGGLSITQQQWNSFERDPLLGFHGDLYTESIPAEGRFSLYASLGYHPRGSALRNRRFLNVVNNQFSSAPAQKFIFHNASLVLGAKQRFNLGVGSSVYYLFGIRGEYTFDTNLDQYTDFNERNIGFAIYPFDDKEFIREINYGVSVGGGMEFMFSEFVGGMIELNISPDFSRQYVQPAITNVRDPYTGQDRTIPQREIRNLAIEISVGIRLLRKIEYIE